MNQKIGKMNSGGDGHHRMTEEIVRVFSAFPEDARSDLRYLRTLIYDTAAELNDAGEIVETLKWGQPSYLTVKPRSGTTIRLGVDAQARPALFCHCQTTLISEFRDQFAEQFDFEKNRALILKGPAADQKDALAICIGQALTYHGRKR